MNIITTLEENIRLEHQKNWCFFLTLEKYLVERDFDWLNLIIHQNSKSLIGSGILNIEDKKYKILLSYSPFHRHRYDRIVVDDPIITFNDQIHLYNDLSLCLYHPIIDKPFLKIIPLCKMIPWISEWVIFYEQWKKYGVWLGKEIKH